MESFQVLVSLNVQVGIMFASTVAINCLYQKLCPLYSFASLYLSFLQSMFLIKINTSPGVEAVGWFDTLWCIVLYSYVVFTVLGILELITSPITELFLRKQSERVLLAFGIAYFILFLATAVVILVICDPSIC